ncbi:hypothetical protein [Sulfitobacter pontiacus]|uniref:hypothetical protein n=1 Tax=Sulfitobacter pontiacus TaxID=60137 RepID=UPI00104CCFCC|nr:hypothetical protein [Sulfitobacter pontiacus]
MSDINELLTHLDPEDLARFTQSVAGVSDAFAARTAIEVDPALIENLPAVREHVLSGGAISLDLEAAIASLRNEPSISAKLIAAEVEAAEINKIQTDTASMSRQERMNYAREHGLDRPRDDVAAGTTINQHFEILKGLGPQQRMAYARRHGIS